MFGEEVIPELWFASLELVNSGDTAIRRSDFDGPVTLNVGGVAILDLIQGEHSPTYLQPEIIQTSDASVVISPILLNSGDSIAFSLFATSPISLDKLTATSRIAGVKSIGITSSVQTTGGIFNWIQTILTILGGFGIVTIIMIPIYFWAFSRRAREFRAAIDEMRAVMSAMGS